MLHPSFAQPISARLLRILMVGLVLMFGYGAAPIYAQYSDAVVAKAESILEQHGLKRVGSQIQTSVHADLTRLFSDQVRESRALKLKQASFEEGQAAVEQIEAQIELLEQQLGQWNAQYAAVGNPQGRNNELVARINAGTAQRKQLTRVRDARKEEVASRKSELWEAEEAYAELIVKMRSIVDQMQSTVADASKVREVEIALQVLATRHESPTVLDAESIVAPLDRKIRKFEESIFSESIDLESENGGLTVRAVIGLEPVSMLIDSGASIVLIPSELAEKLDITPDPDAKNLTLRTADGRQIPAKRIVLPRLRVGKFEAENVEAALLDASLQGAKPLLGMSFLEHFKFEIDTAGKKLKLLNVAAQ
jgi:aspartyl protease family protein